MSSEAHLLARVVFYNSERGGRYTPPQSGFHPQLDLDEEHTSCTVESALKGEKLMAFDVEHEVRLTLQLPERYASRLTDGMAVRLYEGNKLIGEGVATRIFSERARGPASP